MITYRVTQDGWTEDPRNWIPIEATDPLHAAEKYAEHVFWQIDCPKELKVCVQPPVGNCYNYVVTVTAVPVFEAELIPRATT